MFAVIRYTNVLTIVQTNTTHYGLPALTITISALSAAPVQVKPFKYKDEFCYVVVIEPIPRNPSPGVAL
jgi:hypothetical protein